MENHSRGKEKPNFINRLKGNISNKRKLYAQQDSSASESSDESPNEEGTSKFILMAKEELEEDLLEFEDEGEVDLEGELISALEEISRLKLKSKKHKDTLLKYAKTKPDLEDLIKLNIELEESRKIEDIMKREIKEKNQER